MARYCSAALLLLAASPAWSGDVQLVGTFGDKAAIVSIDGGEPKTIKVGQRLGGVTVLSVEKDRATIEVDGKRRSIPRGQSFSFGAADERQSVVLAADPKGHFLTVGSINGGSVRFVVDTGASAVVLPAADATRLGLDYRKGKFAVIRTASGAAPAWRVKLDRVRVGDIELANVDGLVIEEGLDIALLGMTFLNRVDMRRDGETMTLRRRY